MFIIGNFYRDFPTYDPVITEPANLAGVTFSELMTSYVDWTPSEKASLQEQLRYDLHIESCSAPLPGTMERVTSGLLSTRDKTKQGFTYIGYPEYDQEYEEPSTCAKV